MKVDEKRVGSSQIGRCNAEAGHNPSASHPPAVDLPLVSQTRPGWQLTPMVSTDSAQVIQLIAHAMNAAEAAQAEATFKGHFSCVSQNIDDGRNYWVLWSRDSIVGVTGLHFYQWGPPENVWLAWFAVDPALQSKGLGVELLSAAMDVAKQRGHSKMFVETYSTSEFERARAFYCSRGFVECGRVAEYLPGGGEMIVFSKNLGHATQDPYPKNVSLR